MGKYIRKAKTAGEVAVMEVSQSSLGVRTRAKTLALQRLQKSSASAPLATTGGGDGSYLQLRSRRLEKPPIAVQHHDSKRQKQQQHQGSKKESCGQNPNPISDSRVRVSSGSDSVAEKKEGEVDREEEIKLAGNGNDDVINYSNTNNDNNESKDFGGVEASFGENVLDIEARERSTRESTPCSLIRDPESIRTPGSTTRPTCIAEANQRVQNSIHQHIPMAHEMDEFFSVAEEEQQKQFIEKYNFDPMKDKPLPGRYQWEKVDP
ncbi:hypothetical protein PTKIN_Ptkin09bG0222500 [Pterospermum kingtungense]